VLLAAPLNSVILRSLSEGPKQQVELRRETGSPPQTTLRAQLARLAEVGAISKQRRNRFPGVLEYELTPAGRQLLFVATALETWLERAPDGPLTLGDNAAKAAIKALADGWSTRMVRAVAAAPLSLTELDRIIADLSYPSLERRLGAMRLAGQVEARPGNERGTPYAATDWLRQSVAPLIAAARWERRHQAPTTAPMGRHDVEAAFLLAVPLLELPPEVSGSCRMAADMPDGGGRRLAGVMVEVENGGIASCATQLDGHPNAWALGGPQSWLGAVIERDLDQLEVGGDGQLARLLVDGLHGALFGAEVRSQSL
jgi:DNA-binding HxlR family transcriptional regulator